MAKKEPLEKEIQRAICDYLAYRGYFFWRQNTVGVFDFNKGVYHSQPKYSLNGVSDIILVRKGGKVVFLEVKRPHGRQSTAQEEFQRLCEKNEAEYYVVHSLDEVISLGL